MEKEISSGTMLGIVLIALAAVIGLGFGVFSIAKGVANEGVVNVQDNLTTVSESAFEDYDQKIVTGTQVVSAYRQFQGKPYAIMIQTQAMVKGSDYYVDHEAEGVKEIMVDTDTVPYVNYNALLDQDILTELPALKLEKGVMNYAGAFELETNGKMKFDTQIGGISKAGNAEYINSSAKFEANLVKDVSGTTIGIMFTQLPR